MFSLLPQIALLSVVVLGLTYARLVRAISSTGGVPRVGKPGVLGYIKTALRWLTESEAVIIEGRKQFDRKPFVLPTLSGPIFILGPEFLERVRAGPDSVFDEAKAVNEDLQLPYTMDQHQLDHPYQAKVLRTDVNRSIPTYVPEILEESTLAMGETFKATDSEGSISFPVFDTMTHLIARISNRVIFGEELCRNEQFLHAIVRFAETTPVMAPFIQWTPVALRPIVYFILSSVMGGKKGALKFIIPYLKNYMRIREDAGARTGLVSEHIINSALPGEPIEGIAVRLLNINFGSIHTSSIFITQALFEIALLSTEDVDSMRREVEEAVVTQGGYTKAAIDRFYKIDSTLREVGRCYGLMHFALGRVSMLQCDLGDGTYVPAGHRVAIDMKAIHFNPDIYPDPNRCDLFRFSKLREQDGSETKHNFSTVDSTYLPFGAGRHACAGRQFASMELKIMLAHILLEYDVKLPPGVTERSKSLIFNGAVIPDPKAHIVFRLRAQGK